jgi:hypothetical protein
MARSERSGWSCRNSLFGADVAEHVQLLLIFSAHAFFLAPSPVEAGAFLILSSAWGCS